MATEEKNMISRPTRTRSNGALQQGRRGGPAEVRRGRDGREVLARLRAGGDRGPQDPAVLHGQGPPGHEDPARAAPEAHEQPGGARRGVSYMCEQHFTHHGVSWTDCSHALRNWENLLVGTTKYWNRAQFN